MLPRSSGLMMALVRSNGHSALHGNAILGTLTLVGVSTVFLGLHDISHNKHTAQQCMPPPRKASIKNKNTPKEKKH